MDDDFYDELCEMAGELVRVQTPDAVYRGRCKAIDGDTSSFILEDVEELTLYGRPTEKEEEEWHALSELMMIHGSFVETVSTENSRAAGRPSGTGSEEAAM